MPHWGWGWGGIFLKDWWCRPEADGKDMHSLLPISCCWTRMIPQGAFVLSPSLNPQGEGGVQAGGNGEDFCQVSDSNQDSSGFEELRWVHRSGQDLLCLLWRSGWVVSWPWQPALPPGSVAPLQPGARLRADSAPCQEGSRRVCVRQKYGLIAAVIVTIVPVRAEQQAA